MPTAHLRKVLLGALIFLLFIVGIEAFLYYRLTSFPKIKVISEFPGYKIELTDKKLLESYLDKFGFWQEKRSSLVIHLTDKPQAKTSQINCDAT